MSDMRKVLTQNNGRTISMTIGSALSSPEVKRLHARPETPVFESRLRVYECTLLRGSMLRSNNRLFLSGIKWLSNLNRFVISIKSWTFFKLINSMK